VVEEMMKIEVHEVQVTVKGGGLFASCVAKTYGMALQFAEGHLKHTLNKRRKGFHPDVGETVRRKNGNKLVQVSMVDRRLRVLKVVGGRVAEPWTRFTYA
jgi:hypothetical protein